MALCSNPTSFFMEWVSSGFCFWYKLVNCKGTGQVPWQKNFP
jgi:hypothetical protein